MINDELIHNKNRKRGNKDYRLQRLKRVLGIKKAPTKFVHIGSSLFVNSVYVPKEIVESDI